MLSWPCFPFEVQGGFSEAGLGRIALLSLASHPKLLSELCGELPAILSVGPGVSFLAKEASGRNQDPLFIQTELASLTGSVVSWAPQELLMLQLGPSSGLGDCSLGCEPSVLSR